MTGGLGLFAAGVGGCFLVAFLIDVSDSYERLAEDFTDKGMSELEAEYGSEAIEQALANSNVAAREDASLQANRVRGGRANRKNHS
ncbi:hypothetical protein M885DRAFT_517853 [Pelagophyceae sp. CCMP2097]|nr:hypothetical protein M885DRAFT_517853 [Pelagophyceae sp. CCMP2097]